MYLYIYIYIISLDTRSVYYAKYSGHLKAITSVGRTLSSEVRGQGRSLVQYDILNPLLATLNMGCDHPAAAAMGFEPTDPIRGGERAPTDANADRCLTAAAAVMAADW